MTNEELVTVYQQGNNDVLVTLYMQNIGLIEVIARKYQAYAEHDDLMQESYFAVIRAAALWEPDTARPWRFRPNPPARIYCGGMANQSTDKRPKSYTKPGSNIPP